VSNSWRGQNRRQGEIHHRPLHRQHLREYIKTYQGEAPTLKGPSRRLDETEGAGSHDIALALELFTTGSLNVFSHQTNINTNNRILCFDIQDLGEN
jgi:hypothetical protein